MKLFLDMIAEPAKYSPLANAVVLVVVVVAIVVAILVNRKR